MDAGKIRLTHEDGSTEDFEGLRGWNLFLPWLILNREDGSTIVVNMVLDAVRRLEVGPMNTAAAGRQLAS